MFVKIYNASGQFMKAEPVDTRDPVEAIALARLQCPAGARFEPAGSAPADTLPRAPVGYSAIRVIG